MEVMRRRLEADADMHAKRADLVDIREDLTALPPDDAESA
jgi:hypothetical protein